MAYKRDYKKEYREYHGTAAQKKRRAQRNAARRKAMRKGLVRKGDSREVHHVNAPRTGSLRKVRVRVVSRKYNRSQQPDRPGGERKKKKRKS